VGEAYELEAELEPAAGTLAVTSEPPGAEVVLDGASVGRAPLEGLAVPVGEHLVELDLAWHAPWARKIEVADDEQVAIRARLG